MSEKIVLREITYEQMSTLVTELKTNNFVKDKEIERLNNIINKAIDFLKENACIDEDVEYFCDDLRYDDCKKLLNILKGSDEE